MNVDDSAGAGGRVVPVDPQRPEPSVVERAGRLLRGGGLVAFPTETVYGLGANALDDTAVRRIFAAKERSLNDPLIVHIGGLADLTRVAVDVPPLVEVLATSFWPGPLTLVLRKSHQVPDSVTAGLASVAVRVPRHPVAAALLRAAGVPVAAPSANRFTRTSATTAAHVQEDLAGRVDLILDGGAAPIGIESTVLRVNQDGSVELLRPGAVSVEAIDAVLRGAGRGGVARRAGTPAGAPDSAGRAAASGRAGSLDTSADDGPAASPGQMLKHYAPRARLLYFRGPENAARSAMRRALRTALNQGQAVGLLRFEEDRAAFRDMTDGTPGLVAEDLGPASDVAGVGSRLFAAMRRLDGAGVAAIYIRSLPATGLGLAIDDRLTRAAGGRVIDLE